MIKIEHIDGNYVVTHDDGEDKLQACVEAALMSLEGVSPFDGVAVMFAAAVSIHDSTNNGARMRGCKCPLCLAFNQLEHALVGDDPGPEEVN